MFYCGIRVDKKVLEILSFDINMFSSILSIVRKRYHIKVKNNIDSSFFHLYEWAYIRVCMYIGL